MLSLRYRNNPGGSQRWELSVANLEQPKQSLGSETSVKGHSTTIARCLVYRETAMPLPQRRVEASLLIRYVAQTLDVLRNNSAPLLKDGRQRCAKASAEVFKEARVVGATVMGAVWRLDALRAAKPFAVVVEEACEMIEPTIMSVLAVRSHQKLGLVSDHRQLPAFVQNCWFTIAERSVRSVKTSLFERLVSKTDVCSWTVLSEQWRMRHEIAELTRPDYVHLVRITDHASTMTRQVGARVPGRMTESLALDKTMWEHAHHVGLKSSISSGTSKATRRAGP